MTIIDKATLLLYIRQKKPFQDLEVEDIDFSRSTFETDVILDGLIFRGKANFSNVRFQYDASFVGVQFLGEGNFENTIFEGKADFAQCIFNTDISFNKTVFNNEANFGATTFISVAKFIDCRFNGESYFSYAKFSETIFNYSRFATRAFFEGERNTKLFSSNKNTYLMSVFFMKPEEIKFINIDFTKCFIKNTDLSSVELTNVEWPIKRFLFSERKVVYDEKSKEQHKDYSLIEKAYRDLKKNCESYGNYGDGGDFHIGEMEMRRLSKSFLGRYFSILWIYKLLSGYGEKYKLAFTWLLFLIIFFAFQYLMHGLKLNDRFLVSPDIIQYNFSLEINTFFNKTFWSDFSSSLIHSLEVATFQKDKSFITYTKFGKTLEIIESLIIPLQFTLSILAIRRRFKR